MIKFCISLIIFNFHLILANETIETFNNSITRLLQHNNHTSRNSCLCQQANTNAETEKLTLKQSEVEELTCKALNNLLKTYSFQTDGNFKLCSQFWPEFAKIGKTPRFSYSDLDKCEKNNPINTQSNQQINNSTPGNYSVRLPTEEERETFKKDTFNPQRKNSANSCCKNNSKCLETFNKINLDFCIPDNNEKNICNYSPLYIVDNESSINISERNFSYYLDKSIEKPSHLDDYVKHLTYDRFQSVDQLVNSEHSYFTNIAKSTNALVSGVILVPQKIRINPDGSKEWKADSRVLSHELAHACSAIWSQIRMNPNENKDGYKHSSDNFLRSDKRLCQIDASTKSVYKKLLNNDNLSECIIKVAEQGGKKGPLPICKNHCANKNVDEAYADLISMQAVSVENMHKSFPLIFCSGNRDKIHPPSSDVLECLIKHDISFKNKFKKAFNCTKD